MVPKNNGATVTGKPLNFRNCAPLQYNRDVIEGMLHRVFRSTSTWELYHEALTINGLQWKETQDWPSENESETLSKILRAELIPTKTKTRATIDKRDEKPPILMLQYRGNQSQLFAGKLRSITNAQIGFTTRNLKTVFTSLKSSFSRDLKSNMVYKLSC